MKVKHLAKVVLLTLFCASVCTVAAFAQENVRQATQLTADCQYTFDSGQMPSALVDDKEGTYVSVSQGATIQITSDTPIGSLYIKFDRIPQGFFLNVNGTQIAAGQNGFLHEYIPLVQTATTVQLQFPKGASISDIFVFSRGKTPDWVQQWQAPNQAADVLVLPTHSDDDQLYFAGVIPSSVAAGARVQVVYLTNHWNTHDRPHEMLNGLWAAGLTRYPVVAQFPDIYSESLAEAQNRLAASGHPYESIVAFQVEMIRKFRPQVVVTHDVDGEYGHGAHRLNSASAMEAVAASADESKFAQSAKQYGAWDVKKTYVHLYPQEKVVLDLDTGLTYFGGKTAFEVSQQAFMCHTSQLKWDVFTQWIYGTKNAPITKASQISTYNPAKYGLYRTTVGADEQKNSLFEHLVLYGEQERLEKQQQDKALEKEQQANAKLQQKEKQEQQQKRQKAQIIWSVTAALTLIVVAVTIYFIVKKKEKKK